MRIWGVSTRKDSCVLPFTPPVKYGARTRTSRRGVNNWGEDEDRPLLQGRRQACCRSGSPRAVTLHDLPPQEVITSELRTSTSMVMQGNNPTSHFRLKHSFLFRNSAELQKAAEHSVGFDATRRILGERRHINERRSGTAASVGRSLAMTEVEMWISARA